MHQGHADYTSLPIAVTVTEEIVCDELMADEASFYCEWHDHGADSACEELQIVIALKLIMQM